MELIEPASPSYYKRNVKGGIHVNPAELRQVALNLSSPLRSHVPLFVLLQCFEFFDVDRKGYITLQDLKKRLSLFYPNLSLREYKFLMNNKAELRSVWPQKH